MSLARCAPSPQKFRRSEVCPSPLGDYFEASGPRSPKGRLEADPAKMKAVAAVLLLALVGAASAETYFKETFDSESLRAPWEGLAGTQASPVGLYWANGGRAAADLASS